MADQEPFVKLLFFNCPCGARMEKVDNIGLTDTHEMYLYFTCAECGGKVCVKARIPEIWRACPQRPAPEPKLICAPAQESAPKPLIFTPEDLELMGAAKIYVGPSDICG